MKGKYLKHQLYRGFASPNKIGWKKSTWNINYIEVLPPQIKSDEEKELETSSISKFCIPKWNLMKEKDLKHQLYQGFVLPKFDEEKVLQISIILRSCLPQNLKRKSTWSISYIEVLPPQNLMREKYLKHQWYRGFVFPNKIW